MVDVIFLFSLYLCISLYRDKWIIYIYKYNQEKTFITFVFWNLIPSSPHLEMEEGIKYNQVNLRGHGNIY